MKSRKVEEDAHCNKQFALTLSQMMIYHLVDWSKFWEQNVEKSLSHRPKWKNRNGRIKRMSNPFILMKTDLANEIKNIKFQNLVSLFRFLKSYMWPEILIGNDDLRSIVENSSLNYIMFEQIDDRITRIFLPGGPNQDEFTITWDNIDSLLNNKPLLEGKIDGVDISMISSRAWTIAKNLQHNEKYDRLFERFRDKYKTTFPNQKYHNRRSGWINKSPTDYINKDTSLPATNHVQANVQGPPFSIPACVPFPICLPITNDIVIDESNIHLSERILLQGEQTQVNNVSLDENNENLASITFQGYVPVWPTEYPPTFHEITIAEDQYLSPSLPNLGMAMVFKNR
ncbi:24106_t:CDS:1 [Cetraspora pellucida]|uniref:24106_t:CDS:1 n=1 Tax=Cetraspora pellucida TaxID=1433469 RepID=A0A9N8VVQ3_9GLOM|nr:24106_t:CDS:1 [Cetraspora pellucida]